MERQSGLGLVPIDFVEVRRLQNIEWPQNIKFSGYLVITYESLRKTYKFALGLMVTLPFGPVAIPDFPLRNSVLCHGLAIILKDNSTSFTGHRLCDVGLVTRY